VQSRLRASGSSFGSLRTLSSSTSSDLDRKKKTVTYAPQSEYFTESEEDYRRSSTISGRGVVGSSFGNQSRMSQLSKTAIPRMSSKYDELFGPLPSSSSRSARAAMDSETEAAAEVAAGGAMSTSQLKFLSQFDTFTVKEFNSELFDCLTLKLGLSSSSSSSSVSEGKGLTRKQLLLKYLDMEDKNHSGTLSKHSFLAALNALGIAHSFWSKPLQKELVAQLLRQHQPGGGLVAIQDVMKLILFK
jgi:hypothetical protein